MFFDPLKVYKVLRINNDLSIAKFEQTKLFVKKNGTAKVLVIFAVSTS